jgi:hypothetical protein
VPERKIGRFSKFKEGEDFNGLIRGAIHGCWLSVAIHSLPPGFEDQVSGVGFQVSKNDVFLLSM